MASVVKIKRSSVQGKAPTTSDITAGEIALNTRDGKLFSSDGTAVFEVGANLHSLSVGTGGLTIGNNAFTLPTTDGTTNQVLVTDGSGNVTWEDQSAGIQGGFPFFNSNGTQDNISVILGRFPFYDSQGNLDNILVG